MTDTATVTKTSIQIKTPSMWKVVLHNDDFTPVDFVVALLKEVFHKSPDEAVAITEQVHNQGKAQVGLYTKEIAVTKVSMTQRIAEDYEHPLLATAEEA